MERPQWIRKGRNKGDNRKENDGMELYGEFQRGKAVWANLPTNWASAHGRPWGCLGEGGSHNKSVEAFYFLAASSCCRRRSSARSLSSRVKSLSWSFSYS